MRTGDSGASRVRRVVYSAVPAALLAAMLAASYRIVGTKQLSYLSVFGSGRGVAAAAFVVLTFVCVGAALYLLYGKGAGLFCGRGAHSASRRRWLCWDVRGVAAAGGIVFAAWLPYLVLMYPCAIAPDTVTQLYQYTTPAPTYYATMHTWVDAEFIDHHPVFDTLVFGAFYDLGGLLGSHDAGMFVFVVLQSLVSAVSLGAAVCYLERIGLRLWARVAALAFAALFLVFPVYATTVLKESFHAPFFLVFTLMFLEACKTRGRALASPRFVAGLVLVAGLCILTKKTGLYIVVPALLVLLCLCRGQWKQVLAAALSSVLVFSVAFPALVGPAVGGVEPGGRQEMFGMLFQQTVTVLRERPKSVTAEDREAIGRVMDVEQAVKEYKPGIDDPVKNSYRRDCSTGDLVAYLGVWARQGLQHPLTYAKATLKCTGGLYIPRASLSLYAGTAEVQVERYKGYMAEVGRSFDFDVRRTGVAQQRASSLYWFYYDHLRSVPGLALLFCAGLYGGWIPIIALFVLAYSRRVSPLTLAPVVLCMLTLLVCPVVHGRYVFSLLYTAIPTLGWAIASLREPGGP